MGPGRDVFQDDEVEEIISHPVTRQSRNDKTDLVVLKNVTARKLIQNVCVDPKHLFRIHDKKTNLPQSPTHK